MDFYIPSLNTCIEYQGEQHYKFSEYIHGTLNNFYNSVKRDEIKKELSSKHNISIVYIDYKEHVTKELLQSRINN